MDGATLKMWEESLAPGMTSEDSIRAKGWDAQADSLPIPRARSIDETGNKPLETVDFEIREKLGAGGMGVVYTAHQTSINREVALKMVKPEHADSKSASEALMSEAVVTGCLDHPNVVPVYDLGVDDNGRLFYAMKEVEGFPWSALIGEKTLDENLEILLRVSDTIAFAHSKGILHRDLKPQNIMLGSFGEIMVVDWGAASTLSGSNVSGILPTDTAYCGTPAYMAPEMAKADKNRIGEGSDVYLLGAVLYQILTGRPPRCEPNPLICLAAAARNQIDPAEEGGELLRIALKAMAAAPANRYETAEHFQQAIRAYRSHSESLLLQANAKASLEQAKAANDYDLFNQAVFGFREALALWPESPDADQLLDAAKLEYARCALAQHDYELALSQLDESNPEHAALWEDICQAVKERDSRKKRVRRLLFTARTLLATITLLSIAGFFIIRAEQRKTEAHKTRASAEHRGSLISLIAAHYGNQNYEAAVSTFWHLVDLYGTNGLSAGTMLKARVSAAMNPYKGWLGEAHAIPQTLNVGGYELKRPAPMAIEIPDRANKVPKHLQELKPVAVGISPNGRRYALLTGDGRLVSGSVEPGGFYLEQIIEKRDIVRCSLLENGLTALHEKNGTVHFYDMNTFAVRTLALPGKTRAICAGEAGGSFFGLVNAGGKLGVFDVPVWKRWDSPYRLLAYVHKGSRPSWEDFVDSVQQGRDSSLLIERINGVLELVLRSDQKPVLDSRHFSENLKSGILSVDGSFLAMLGADGRFHVMRLKPDLQPIPSVAPTPVHYVAKAGMHEWPYDTDDKAATNLQHVLHVVSQGDTVLVSDGVYEMNEEIAFNHLGGITLKSSGGRDSCILVQKGAGRFLRLSNGDGLTVVEGFTFKGTGSGGGLELYGSENAVVSNCRFVGNHSERPGGGLNIVSMRSERSEARVTDCVFSNNASGQKGGGLTVVLQSHHGVLAVSNCVFTSNSSMQAGGGGYLQTVQGKEGWASVAECRFEGNKATEQGGSGGGLSLQLNSVSGGLLVSNSVFTANRSHEGSGGGAFVTHNGKRGAIEVVDCVLSSNSARLLGGGLSANGNYADTLIHRCRFDDNEALSGGGVIAQVDTGFALIDRCEVLRNRAESYGGGVGGHRIYPQFKLNRIVSNCLIAGNHSDYQAGGVRDRILVNCTLENNSAGLGGGATFCVLQGCTVINNVAARHSDLYKCKVLDSTDPNILESSIHSLTNAPGFFELEKLLYNTHYAPPGFESTP